MKNMLIIFARCDCQLKGSIWVYKKFYFQIWKEIYVFNFRYLNKVSRELESQKKNRDFYLG